MGCWHWHHGGPFWDPRYSFRADIGLHPTMPQRRPRNVELREYIAYLEVELTRARRELEDDRDWGMGSG